MIPRLYLGYLAAFAMTLRAPYTPSGPALAGSTASFPIPLRLSSPASHSPSGPALAGSTASLHIPLRLPSLASHSPSPSGPVRVLCERSSPLLSDPLLYRCSGLSTFHPPKICIYQIFFISLHPQINLKHIKNSYRYLYVLDFVILQPYLNHIISIIYNLCHNT